MATDPTGLMGVQPKTPTTQPSAPPPDPTQTVQANLTAAVQSAPQLASAPGAAVNVAVAGGNVRNTAQAVATQGNRVQRAATATPLHQGHPGGIMGFLSDLGHGVAHLADPLTDSADVLHYGIEDPISGVLKASNAGMSIAQHEFRYLYDVYEQHGHLAAYLEGLAIVGTLAAGLVFTGGASDVAELGALGAVDAAGETAADAAATAGADALGEDAAATAGRSALLRGAGRAVGMLNKLALPTRATLPALGVGEIEGHAFYRDSWNRTANGSRYLYHGHTVNFGDVIAGLTGLKGDAHWAVSAPLNAIFDFLTDPVNSYLSDVSKAREGGSALGTIDTALTSPATKVFGYHIPAEELSRVIGEGDTTAVGRAYQQTAQWLADATPAQILRAQPGLAPLMVDREVDGVLLRGLANAHTADEVSDVLRRVSTTGEMMNRNVLPTMSLSKLKSEDLKDFLRNRPTDNLHPFVGMVRHPIGNLQHLLYGLPKGDFVKETREFKLPINLVSMRGGSDLLKFLGASMGSDQAADIVDKMYEADVPARQIMLRNAIIHAGFSEGGLDLTDWQNHLGDNEWWNRRLANELSTIRQPKVREAVQRFIDNMLQSDPGSTGVFGTTRAGESAAPVVDEETGREIDSALYKYQLADFHLPDYNQVHRMGQMLAGAQRFTGTLDDFMIRYVTRPFFNRNMLLSGGYAIHIGASEALMNLWKYGIGEYASHSYALVKKSLGTAAERNEDDLRGMTAYAFRVITGQTNPEADLGDMGRLRRVLARLPRLAQKGKHAVVEALDNLPDGSQKIMQRAQELGELTDQNMHTLGTAAGHPADSGFDDAMGANQTSARNAMERMRFKHGDHYTQYGPEHMEHVPQWRVQLNLRSRDAVAQTAAKAIRDTYAAGGSAEDAYKASVRAVRDALENMDPAVKQDFLRSTQKARNATRSMTPETSWAHVVTEDIMGLTHSPQGVAHDQLLANIADGNETPIGVLKNIDASDRPLGIPGRELLPDPHHFWARVAAIGFQRVLMPIVDAISRDPITLLEYSARRDAWAGAVAAGLMTDDEAMVRSVSEATNEVIRMVHNLHDRAVFDQLTRNWMPFFFAQEQAYRRMGRLLADDPGAFRRYMLMLQSTHDLVAKVQDGNGNQYFALPGAGILDHAFVSTLGLLGMPTASLNPTGFGGTLSSANVVFPFANGARPDISPVVTLGAQALSNLFEEFGSKYSTFEPVASAVQGAIGSVMGSENMSENILQQLIPNTAAYRIVEAFGASDTSFVSAMTTTIQALAYQQNVAMSKWVAGGEKGPQPDIIPPADASPQQLQAFLAKVKNQTRAIYFMRAILGAISPVSAEETVSDYGMNAKLQAAINSSSSVAAGFQKFLEENPNGTPYVVSKSQTATGASIPDTQAALDWLQQNVLNPKSPLSNYEYGAMWLMPRPANTTGDNAYSAQAYLEEIADGLRTRDTPSQFLDQIYAENGDQIYYNALAQHEAALQAGADPTTEYAKWDAYMQNLQATQPIWWSVFNNGQRQQDAVESLNQLQEIVSKGLLPKTAQAQGVGALVEQFENYEAQYQQAGTEADYSTAQKEVNDQWIQYVDGVADANPNLQSVISSVFRDALTYYNET